MRALLVVMILALLPMVALGQQTDPGCTDGSNLECECVELSNGRQVWLDNEAAAEQVEKGHAQYCTLGIEFVENEVSNDEIPAVYRVDPAYPNPFNPSTNFTLTVNRGQDVAIEVYNLLGQRVMDAALTLDDQDSRVVRVDLAGQSSGTYTIVVRGENFVASQTIVMVK